MGRKLDQWELENPDWEKDVPNLTKEQEKAVFEILHNLGRNKGQVKVREYIEHKLEVYEYYESKREIE